MTEVKLLEAAVVNFAPKFSKGRQEAIALHVMVLLLEG